MIRFNLSVIAFCFLFLLLAGKSEAALEFQGCHPDTVTAAAAIRSNFPKIENGTVLDLVGVSVLPSGFTSLDIQQRALNSTVWTLNPQTYLQLPSCDSSTSPVVSNSTVVIICAAVVLAMMGFAAGKGYR
jgi:hypothetical protein